MGSQIRPLFAKQIGIFGGKMPPKSKKGSKQQKYIATVTHQVKHGDQKQSQRDKENREKEKAKEGKLAMKAELNMLFKPVDQKVPKGVDPKSVLCNFFKQGQC